MEQRGDQPSLRYDFGDLELGQFKEATFQFKNVGVGQLRIRDVEFTSPRGDFRLEDVHAAPDLGIPGKPRNTTLSVDQSSADPGYAAVFRVRFTPTEYGPHAGDLWFFSNALDALMYTISLSARCVGLALEILPATVGSQPHVEFGDVVVGTTRQQSITVLNVGGSDAIVSDLIASDAGLNQQFSAPYVIPDRFVPVGQTRTFPLTFAPSRSGQASASIKLVADSAPAPSRFHREYAIEVVGRGVAPVIVLDPPAVDFGALAPGTTSTRSFLIRNDGEAPLHVSGILLVAGGTSFQGVLTTRPVGGYV